jgi:hypothetical protein
MNWDGGRPMKSRIPWGRVKVFRRPTTAECESKRDANGNTIDVEFNPNPPTHLCMQTGGEAAEDLAPPTNSNPVRETRVQQVC